MGLKAAYRKSIGHKSENWTIEGRLVNLNSKVEHFPNDERVHPSERIEESREGAKQGWPPWFSDTSVFVSVINPIWPARLRNVGGNVLHLADALNRAMEPNAIRLKNWRDHRISARLDPANALIAHNKKKKNVSREIIQ